MENVPIFIKHNGVWESDNSFVNFSVNGVLVTSGCNFEELVSVIANQLEKDLDTDLIDIKYIVKDGYPPMTVHSDMSVRVYIELKRMNAEFTMYPLCVTFKDKCTAGSCSNVNPATVSSDGIQSENRPDIYLPDAVEMISPVRGKDCDGIQGDDKGIMNNQDTVEMMNSVHGEDSNGVRGDEEGIINNVDIVEPISSVHGQDWNGIQHDDRCIVLIDNPRHQDVEEGQLYLDKETIVNVMRHYAIRNNFQFRVERSSSTSYCLLCPEENCSWCFKSSSLHKSKLFKIRMFNDVHTCSIEERLHSCLSSAGIIGGMIRNKYADSESVYSPADIIRDMKKDYGVDLTYMRAWRSKQKALKMLRGNKIESYVKLPSYLYMLMHTNPGSIVRLQKSEGGSFLYVFVSLDASIKGWKYCKPIVIVNASLLESAHRGTLIMAYTQDAAGRIFLLAYSVVDSENDASWKWFFERFRDAYGAREGMCIVSDMHESISKATSIVYPEVLHCICMFHLWNNIKTRYTKIHTPVKELFFASARAYTIEEFERHMVAINNIDKRVGECLLDVGYHRWSRVHSKVNGTTIMTSNIVESMNTVNNHARDLPILHLLEYMTKLVQDWHYANKINAVETSTELGKKYEEIMKENYTTSQRMTVKPSSDYVYTVVDDEKQFVVNLRERTCTCIRFQMDEMPCPHALAVTTFKSMDAYQYCSVYYNKDHLLKTYDICTYPVPNESTWDIPREVLEEVVLPPTGKIRPGRPKRLRI